MTADEWTAWLAANRRLAFGRSDSPCRDCTPEFHHDMLAAGTCDGTPLPEPLPGGRPLISPALPDWEPQGSGRPRYHSDDERAAARRESGRRAHRRIRLALTVACVAQ